MIDIEKEQDQEQEKQNDVTENNTDSNIDNFNLLDDNFNLVKKEVNSIDFCENNTYKLIVTLILIIIVLYFIWYIYTNNNGKFHASGRFVTNRELIYELQEILSDAYECAVGFRLFDVEKMKETFPFIENVSLQYEKDI
jgi:hypothetical protein